MIERTFDVEYVLRAVTHPKIWKWVSDDSSDIATYRPPMDDCVYWLKVIIEGRDYGVYMIHPHNSTTCEIHTCLFPEARGRIAKLAIVEALDWIFSNTGFLKIITHVPETNPLAYAYAKRSGFKDEGINRKSIRIEGKLIDQFTLGLTWEEYKCQQ